MPTQCLSYFLIDSIIPLFIVALITMPAWGQSRGRHFITNVRGDVFVGSTSVDEGDLLTSDHRLRVKPNSQVTIVCSNHTSHPLNPGNHKVSDYCPTFRRRRPGSRNPTRDPFNPKLPHIISPRNTALLSSDSLVIQWKPSPGATQYVVRIKGRDVDWNTQTNRTEVPFPKEKGFQFDYRYSVTVTDNNSRTSKVGLALLPPSEVTRIEGQIDQIKALMLEPDIEAIGIGLAYRDFMHSDSNRHSFALNHSALEVLEERIQSGTKNSQIYLLQADNYLRLNLLTLAQEYYQKALTFSKSANQQQRQAQSYLGLAAVAEERTEFQTAIDHMESAVKLHEELGDRDHVKILKTRIKRLKVEETDHS